MKSWLKKKLNTRWHRPNDPSDRRLWIYIKDSCLTIESHFLKRAHHCSIGLDLNSGDGDEITANLCLPWLFSIYISFASRALRRLMPGEWTDGSIKPGEKFWMPTERQIGVRIFNGVIWVSLWENPMESNCTDPWWWSFNIKPVDFLFGKERIVAEKVLDERLVKVRFPEAIYDVSFKLFRRWDKRPRWKSKRFDICRIEMDPPIPVPGKGENAWDIGEDAIWSISCNATSIDQAVIKLLDSVNRSRVRYGGATWLPGTQEADTEKAEKPCSPFTWTTNVDTGNASQS